MRIDTIFYQLFQTFPRLLWQILGRDPDLAENYEFSAREIKELAFRLDGLFLPKTSGLPLYFLEVQYQRVDNFYWRFITEIFLYFRQYQPQETWLAVDPGLPNVYEGLARSGHLPTIYLEDLAYPIDAPLEQQILSLVVAAEDAAKAQLPSLRTQLGNIPDGNRS